MFESVNQFSLVYYITIVYYLYNVNCIFIGLLANIGVRNIRHLTPQCKKFYSIINQLIRKQCQSGIKKVLFKNRLKKAEKFDDLYMTNKLNGKVMAAASLYIRKL